jgi:glycosyltransferase involved in cell wall biosynthesis
MKIKPVASVILLNYQKKESLLKTISSIREQTVQIEIILIDNSQKDECRDVGVDHLITTTRNLHCKSRFLAASWATTDYIFTLDDDVVLASSDVIQRYIQFFDSFTQKDSIILVDKDNHYSFLDGTYPKEYSREWSHTNYGKGRFLFFHRDYLNNVSIGYKDFINPKDGKHYTGIPGYNIGDDYIGIDDISFQKSAKWVMFQNYFSAIKDQETSMTGLHQKEGHYHFRYEWIKENNRNECFTKTELCSLFEKWGSDKCREYFHTYSQEYYNILKGIKHSARNVLEIGVGSFDLMGGRIVPLDKYNVGASLRAWCDFFPGSKIWGIDIREDVLFEDERIKCLWTDQSSSIELDKTISQIREDQKDEHLEFDLIVDDGSHVVEHQITSIKTLSKYLKMGGYYIIEDIKNRDLDIFRDLKVEEITMIRAYSEWIDKSPGQNSFVLYQKV